MWHGKPRKYKPCNCFATQTWRGPTHTADDVCLAISHFVRIGRHFTMKSMCHCIYTLSMQHMLMLCRNITHPHSYQPNQPWSFPKQSRQRRNVWDVARDGYNKNGTITENTLPSPSQQLCLVWKTHLVLECCTGPTMKGVLHCKAIALSLLQKKKKWTYTLWYKSCCFLKSEWNTNTLVMASLWQ